MSLMQFDNTIPLSDSVEHPALVFYDRDKLLSTLSKTLKHDAVEA